MSTKEAQELIVANMKKWQKIENAGVASTAAVMEKTTNPIVRMVMEIIQRDSQMHYHVQGLIAESIERGPFTMTPEDLVDVWDLIEKHIKLERSTIELAKETLGAMEGKSGLTVQRYLLDYLLKDEEKHDYVLENLQAIKKSMYPYG